MNANILSGRQPARPEATEHFDVIIVGAGISGVGSAYHMRTQCPDKRFVVLESKDSYGGTWHTHRYPGVRSDSDLYTFGYRFKPWMGKPIATAEEILSYMAEVIEENDLAQHIRYRHRIDAASWSSAEGLWTLDATRLESGERVRFTTNFLWMCQGYYRHDQGYLPAWTGMDNFKGPLIHAQTWPEELDVQGKRVVVIGSGATAATVVPGLARLGAKVTMLQRSPTYFISGRNANDLANELRRLEIDPMWIHAIIRKKVLMDGAIFARRSREEPEEVRKELLAGVRAQLGEDFELEPHFSPRYRPWQQRVAFIPDGDMFAEIREGNASVVTDEIDRFVEDGVVLKSNEKLDADIVVAATGFQLSVLGDIPFSVDGLPLDFSKTVTYRGMMFTGVPNMVWVFGYFRASWTLRVDMVADFVCRLLKHMDATGATQVTPQLREDEKDMPLSEWIDADNFNPGYLMRDIHLMPRSGNTREWQHTQDYWGEKDEFPEIDLTDGVFRYDANRPSGNA
ncbi:flavin-containing monooxygenase [Cupriavidus metallidurans]|jgi:cation diffusion facilitator CzcD-associated flavoprotein CzcO|uniref:flavin-containing monooxygenase n=1 Tax=Cupriavidus metallidurans TaxID=119219 RepID=UPI00076371C7|nr:NAD(P)/FAD-dependent oxidoreductase [Cupriavidus metallidurans]KWW37039.1 FAD-containing monooxygenase EthA [Cupriavidus metallidurans]